MHITKSTFDSELIHSTYIAINSSKPASPSLVEHSVPRSVANIIAPVKLMRAVKLKQALVMYVFTEV